MFLIDIYGLYLFGLVKNVLGATKIWRVPSRRATRDLDI